MKRSAGVLVYRKKENQLEVLLCHMGGPYWKEIDLGGWSLPKGEAFHEKVIDTALREFHEETNLSVPKEELQFLGSKKQSNRKLVIMFAIEKDFDLTDTHSNTFQKEWPKGSGIMCEFPEMDRYEWFSLDEAQKKILKGQIYFLEKLKEKTQKSKKMNIGFRITKNSEKNRSKYGNNVC